MELIELLKAQDWSTEESPITTLDIEKARKAQINHHVSRLYASYYKGLLLNLAFASVFGLVYLLNPEPQFLVPVVIILSCFLFLVVNLFWQLINNPQVDSTQPTVRVLEQSLALNQKMYAVQCKYNAWIVTLSFTGGFMLGLAFQGWTIEKYIERPIVLLILGILTVGFYWFFARKRLGGLSRWLNPSYFSAKEYLEQQLQELNLDRLNENDSAEGPA